MSGPAVLRLRQWLHRLAPSVWVGSPENVEQAEVAWYRRVLRPGMTVFDIGAHVGRFTALFSECVGAEGQVHAFEAVPAALERLAQRCAQLPHQNVIINGRAVAERAGAVTIHVYDQEHLSWSSLAQRPLAAYGIAVNPVGVELVEAVTVDAYCRERGIGLIDVLKIDVEGAEYQVLLGARHLLQEQRIRHCIFEFGQTTLDMGNDPGEIRGFLAGCKYRLKNLLEGDPVFPRRLRDGMACFSMHVATPEAP